MTMIRELISAWALPLIGSLLLPLASFASLPRTTYDTPYTTTTTPVTIAQYTKVVEAVICGGTSLRSEASSQSKSFFGQNHFLNAPRRITVPSSAQKLIAESGDDVLIGVVEQGGKVRLFKAGPGQMIGETEILGHADLIKAGVVKPGQGQGFSVIVKEGKVDALFRRSMLNSEKGDFLLPSETTEGILKQLGAPGAKVLGN